MASEKKKKSKAEAGGDLPDRTKNKRQPKAKSAEFVTETDDESDPADVPPAKSDVKKKTANGTPAKTKLKSKEKPIENDDGGKSSQSPSDSDSSTSGSPAKPRSKLKSKSKPESRPKAKAESESESESKSGSSSESGSESNSDSSSKSSSTSSPKLKPKSAKVSKSAEIAEQTGSEKPVRGSARRENLAGSSYSNDFKAPAGFDLVGSSERIELSESVREILQDSSLEGKQVWHITAPSYVPLRKLQEISLQAIQKQEVLMTHKDSRYYLAALGEGDEVDNRLVVPDGSDFRTVKIPVSKSLRIQQAIDNVYAEGTEDHDALRNFTATQTYPKESPPVQPSGLKMRYQAFGVVEKRKAEDLASPKKKKAKRQDKQEVSSQLAPPEDEITPEEKARQKAEKKARKEQKRLLKEKEKSKKARG